MKARIYKVRARHTDRESDRAAVYFSVKHDLCGCGAVAVGDDHALRPLRLEDAQERLVDNGLRSGWTNTAGVTTANGIPEKWKPGNSSQTRTFQIWCK